MREYKIYVEDRAAEIGYVVLEIIAADKNSLLDIVAEKHPGRVRRILDLGPVDELEIEKPEEPDEPDEIEEDEEEEPEEDDDDDDDDDEAETDIDSEDEPDEPEEDLSGYDDNPDRIDGTGKVGRVKTERGGKDLGEKIVKEKKSRFKR